MFKKKKFTGNKTKILLVDEMNDLQSQIAEYFINEMYGDMYDVCSAGPKSDCINCELISVMYQVGYDIRSWRSKDFNDPAIPDKYDYLVFLEKSTYDRINDIMPWTAPHIMKDFGRKDNFERATDDVELADCFKDLIEKVRVWVEETFADPENLKSLVL